VQQFDLIVIGSGPAGEKGAVQAAYFGKRVALIEHDISLGGACVNTGTIPSKILRESALYFSGIKQRGLYGLDYSLKEGLTVKNFMHRKDVIVEAQRQKVLQNLVAHGVELMRGVASFEDANIGSREAEHPRLRRVDCNRFGAASRARHSVRRQSGF